jgi:diguanylate cyclase (GGDEF)-like protein/PAS domain S-box-containing protein
MNAPDVLRALRAADTLRAAIDSTSAGMVVVDSSGHIVDCNPAAEQMLGLGHGQRVGAGAGDPHWRTIDPDGNELALGCHPVMQALHSGEPLRGAALCVVAPSGERRWLSVHTHTIRFADGAIGAEGIVATFVDVSAQHALEAALAEQQRRLHAALEGSRTATWEWNVRTGETRCDDGWAAILGLRKGELEEATTIRSVTRLVHSSDQARVADELRRHFARTTEFYDVECRLQHRDGNWRWVQVRGRVNTWTPDGLAEWMSGTLVDITQRKASEAATARDHELMRALFELSPLGLQLIDVKQRRVCAANEALVRITGYTLPELLEGDPRDHLPADWRSTADLWFDEMLKGGRFGPAEVECRHKAGHVIHVVLNGVRVTNSSDEDFLWLSMQDVSDHRTMERALRLAASSDRLTGLANRAAMLTALQERVGRAGSAPGLGFAVMFLDFDRFKLVNDTLGHDAGDELLCGIAIRLRNAALAAPTGADWLVARFGGDEFVVLMPGVADLAAAGHEADALLQALAEPYQIKQQEVHSSASIGIALWNENVTSADELLRDADTAMYEAKHAGRARWVPFDDTMRARLTRAVKIENELRYAVVREQLHVVYQPIVDLETGGMTSVEALLRWSHPELGEVSPVEFIPVAEESRHIIALGEWILRESCRQWTAWQQENPAAAPAMVSVNLSRVQMTLGERMLETVRDALACADMPAAALQLEITEREVMKDPAAARELMLGLAAMGVRLAMDDFGTGTSSLGCLRDYPFHTIKIDKSFVTGLFRDPHVLAVAHATVNVIENLGMISVAEGIEDPGEVATLQSLGCRYGQGHLFARAVPADRVLTALAGSTG